MQCTCMTAENLHRARNGRVRYTGAATLPRMQPRSVDDYKISYDGRSRVSTHASSSSVYDNVAGGGSRRGQTTTANVHHKLRHDGSAVVTTTTSAPTTAAATSSSRPSSDETVVKSVVHERSSDIGRGEERHPGRPSSARNLYAQSTRKEQAKSIDCSSMMEKTKERPSRAPELQPHSRSKSKSSDNVFEQSQVGNVPGLSLDSNTLKRMLHPLPAQSSHSSPEQQEGLISMKRRELLRKLESDNSSMSQSFNENRGWSHRSETGRRRSLERSLCLDLTDADQSPPSDHFLYDNFCYATTPSSSNENSDAPYVSSDEAPGLHAPTHTPSSPTSRLLLEYEMHLRNALARGLDAESYSLHTFEALLSQSMENVGKYQLRH